MGSSGKIVSGVVWSTVVNVVNAVYGFIAVPILINHFGKAEYGLIGLRHVGQRLYELDGHGVQLHQC